MRSALSPYNRTAPYRRPTAPPEDRHPEPTRLRASEPTADVLLTVAEACAELRVSKWTLYQYIHSRQLASVKLRSRRLIPRSAIRALVKKLTVEAMA